MEIQEVKKNSRGWEEKSSVISITTNLGWSNILLGEDEGD
jgi:hypothetical protein